MEEKRANCLKCKHYFITWDAQRPRGCRVFGFKSDKLPSQIVEKETGQECNSFQEKKISKETEK